MPRLTELVRIKYTNSILRKHALYIYQGEIIIVTRYIKSKYYRYKEFNIAWFLPARAGSILLRYLIYI